MLGGPAEVVSRRIAIYLALQQFILTVLLIFWLQY